MAKFGEASWRKIERAKKHIYDIDLLRLNVTGSQNYSLIIEQDSNRINWLTLDFDAAALPAPEAALIIGDALHNLRSALDILWHEVIQECSGTPTRYSRFLIEDSRDALEKRLIAAVKDKRISELISELMLDTVKPYPTGNYCLWALDDLNVRDKHKLIIPMLKWVWITGVRFEDDEGNVLDAPILIADRPWRERLSMDFYAKNLTVKDKGPSAPNVFFDQGFPFEGEPVVAALDRIREVVTSTVKSFETFFGFA
jgi:hypothetical protein